VSDGNDENWQVSLRKAHNQAEAQKCEKSLPHDVQEQYVQDIQFRAVSHKEHLANQYLKGLST